MPRYTHHPSSYYYGGSGHYQRLASGWPNVLTTSFCIGVARFVDKLTSWAGLKPQSEAAAGESAMRPEDAKLWDIIAPFIPCVMDQGLAKLLQSVVKQRPSTDDPAFSARPVKSVMGLFHLSMRYAELLVTLSDLLGDLGCSLRHARSILGFDPAHHLQPSQQQVTAPFAAFSPHGFAAGFWHT